MGLQFDKRSFDGLQGLENLLRDACHAPGCACTTTCPEMCACKFRRKFKLNNATALCWVLADSISHFIRQRSRDTGAVAENDVLSLYAEVSLIRDLARYHHTPGWQTFFRSAVYVIAHIIRGRRISSKLSEYDWIQITNLGINMRKSLNRLKREKKGA